MILVVAVLGYGVLSGQLSPGQLLDELLGGAGDGGMPAAAQNTPSAEAARRQLSELQVRPAGSMAGYSMDSARRGYVAINIDYRIRANNAVGNLVYPFYIRDAA